MSRQEEHVVPRSAEAIVWRRQTLPIVVVQTIIIVGLLSAVAFVEDVPKEVVLRDENVPDTTIAWHVSEEGNNWVIEIIDVQPESLDEVSWSMLNLNRLVATWDDPSGDTLRMEGDMIDIIFSQTEYNEADVNDSNKFYSRDPSGTPPVSNNHTLCIVFMDVNSDGKMTSGDVIWIRSNLNGGAAFEDFRIRMVREKGSAYGEKILPPLTGTDTYDRRTDDRAKPVGDRFGGAILGLSVLNLALVLLLFILPFRYRRGKRYWHILKRRSTVLAFIISAVCITLILTLLQVTFLFHTALFSINSLTSNPALFSFNSLTYKPDIILWVSYSLVAFVVANILIPVIIWRFIDPVVIANGILITSLVTAIITPSFAEAIDHDPLWWVILTYAILIVVSSMLILISQCRRSGQEVEDGQ